MQKVALLSSFVLTAFLSGCGGGSSPTAQDSPPPSPTPTTPTTPQATAAVQTPNNLAWNIATPLAVVLKDPSGNVIPAAQVTCAANNTTNLTVAADCSAVTGHRLGNHAIVVSGGGVTANAAITVVPQQQALGMHTSGADWYSLVVTPNQQVLAWGENASGVLGQNKDIATLPGATLPVAVLNSAGNAPLADIAQVSKGVGASLALTISGQVYEWGGNFDVAGARVDGATNNAAYLPGFIANSANNGALSHIVQVSLGDRNAAALSDDGTVYTWGYYTGQPAAQVGSSIYAKYPGQVKTSSGVLTNVVSVSAGYGFTLALTSAGQVYAWGYTNKDVGGPTSSAPTGGETAAATPITRADNGQPLSNIVAISTGYFVSLALDSSGHVWAWGGNTQGELGQGNTSSVTGAVQVKDPSGTGLLSNIKMVAAGTFHCLAMDASGTVWSWGFSQDGQLGDGINHPRVNSSSLPAVVVSEIGTGSLTGAVAIAADGNSSFALMPDGRILYWGLNIYGSAGQGGTLGSNSRVPGQALYLYVPTPVMNPAGTGSLSIAPLSAYQNLTNRGIF